MKSKLKFNTSRMEVKLTTLAVAIHQLSAAPTPPKKLPFLGDFFKHVKHVKYFHFPETPI